MVEQPSSFILLCSILVRVLIMFDYRIASKLVQKLNV